MSIPKSSYSKFKRQRGVSLVELMVGITIGLLVVVAALGSLVFTQATSSVVGDSARLQQNADNIFRILGFNLQKAGAIVLNANPADPSRVVFSDLFTGFDRAVTGATAAQIFSVHGIEGAGNAPDTLRLSYQDDGLDRDCLGNRPDAAQVGIRVDNTFTADLTTNELNCLGAQVTVGAQPIAGGIEDFQVTYGVQTLNAAGALQYRFYAADVVPDWSNIQAVNICIQLVGEIQGNPQPGLVVTGCRGQNVANDGLLRKVYQRNYSLRNALL